MSHSIVAPTHSEQSKNGYRKIGLLLRIIAWCLIALGAYQHYGHHMDYYDKSIGIGALIGVIVFTFRWQAFSTALLVAVVGGYSGSLLYHNDLTQADQRFMLKYFLSSQSAISWMSACFFLSWGSYSLGNVIQSSFSQRLGSCLAWCAITLGCTGLLVRWYESYLYGSEIGHIPISNLYEVLVLFCLVTTTMYLYFESRYQRYELGAWIMGIISGWVVFLLWYGMTRQAHEIQPLVPALQSYWMKIHVPANFIGYGGFTVAAMTGMVLLIKKDKSPIAEKVLAEWMYRSITVGFAFFTIATILGAIWAAEAWGGYWSWDPKEVWALIVWLNYAAWLHFRLTKGQNIKVLSVWAVAGFFITLFAFLGVNMFLSGLHSYGKL